MTKKSKILIAIIAAAAICAAAALIFWGDISNLYLQISKTPNEHGYYTVNGYVTQLLGEVKPKMLSRFTAKLNTLKNDYLSPKNKVFFALVPDKSYHLQDFGYEKADYTQMREFLRENLTEFHQIELCDTLEIDDYYKTDGHWRQENLPKVVELFAKEMDFQSAKQSFIPTQRDDFIGASAKYASNVPPSESLVYLTNDIINAAVVDNYDNKDFTKVYNEQLLGTDMAYDVFLGGATPYIKITSPLAQTDRELVIFRDSFASSLAPLFLAEYKTITMIDLRYMASPLLKEMVSFDSQDVLFLYSTSVVANSGILR